MSYASYLRSLLRPLGIYDLSPTSFSGAELEALGAAADQLSAALDLLELETNAATAGDDGLARFESLFSIAHTPSQPDARRLAVAGLMLIQPGAFTLESIEKTLSACGLEVSVRESGNETIEINFPGVPGIPEDFDRVQSVIEGIIPCHLETVYDFNYIRWDTFELKFSTFNEFDSLVSSWDALELMYL